MHRVSVCKCMHYACISAKMQATEMQRWTWWWYAFYGASTQEDTRSCAKRKTRREEGARERERWNGWVIEKGSKNGVVESRIFVFCLAIIIRIHTPQFNFVRIHILDGLAVDGGTNNIHTHTHTRQCEYTWRIECVYAFVSFLIAARAIHRNEKERKL